MMRHRLIATDALFGFQKVIEAAWFYPGRIEPGILRYSLSELGNKYSVLQSRVSKRETSFSLLSHPTPPFSGWLLEDSHERIPLTVRELELPSIEGFLDIKPDDVLLGSIDQGSVMRGKSSVMEVSLTRVKAQNQVDFCGSVLSICLSHAVSDAAGMHLLLCDLGRSYRQRLSMENGENVDSEEKIGEIATLCTDRHPILRAMWQDGGSSSITRSESVRRSHTTTSINEKQAAASASQNFLDLRGHRGRLLWWSLQKLTGLSNGHGAAIRRAHLSFSRKDLDKLMGRTPSAKNAGEALCGNLLREILRGTSVQSVRLEMPVNMRNISGTVVGDKFVGNAVHVFPSGEPLSVSEPTRNDLSCLTDQFIRAMQVLTKRILDEPEKMVKEWLEFSRKLEEGILLDGSEDQNVVTITVNSHRRLAKETTSPGDLFGKDVGACIRFLPGQSDTLQLLPGVGKSFGGIDVLVTLPHALQQASEQRLAGTTALVGPHSCWVSRLESDHFRESVLRGPMS